MLPDRVPTVPHGKPASECYIEFYPATPAMSRGKKPLKAATAVVLDVPNSRAGASRKVFRRGLKSFQVRAEKSLRVCRAVVTRVQSSRYAYAKQSLRACEAVVTSMRSSRYARPEQPHCASGHEFYAYIWKIFSAPPIKFFSRWRFYDKKPPPPRCILSS